jgi:hypothetical protein
MHNFFTTLTLIFITLKLTNVITWSWLLVFAPMLISFGIAVALLIGFFTICLVDSNGNFSRACDDFVRTLRK